MNWGPVKPVIEISSALIMQILRYLSEIGIEQKNIFDKAGVELSDIDSPDKRVPIQQFYAIQEAALRITGDETFGLHLGTSAEPGNWLILGYIVMNCSTLSEALDKLCRYEEVLGNFIRIYLSVSKKEAVLSFDIKMPDAANIRHCYEAAVSSVITMVRTITGRHIEPVVVTFPHDAPGETEEYDHILSCPVIFNKVSTTIVFYSKDLDIPATIHNSGLLEIFEEHAKNAIDDIHADNHYTRKVNALILEWLSDGTPGIERVAKELSVSVRSLQTRLSEEGVTFRQLLETVRKEMASGYLKDRRFSIDDITYLLGYSEPTIFRKTFKKWMGITPGDYRRQASGCNS